MNRRREAEPTVKEVLDTAGRVLDSDLRRPFEIDGVFYLRFLHGKLRSSCYEMRRDILGSYRPEPRPLGPEPVDALEELKRVMKGDMVGAARYVERAREIAAPFGLQSYDLLAWCLCDEICAFREVSLVLWTRERAGLYGVLTHWRTYPLVEIRLYSAPGSQAEAWRRARSLAWLHSRRLSARLADAGVELPPPPDSGKGAISVELEAESGRLPCLVIRAYYPFPALEHLAGDIFHGLVRHGDALVSSRPRVNREQHLRAWATYTLVQRGLVPTAREALTTWDRWAKGRPGVPTWRYSRRRTETQNPETQFSHERAELSRRVKELRLHFEP
jgi:hypothetical protein